MTEKNENELLAKLAACGIISDVNAVKLQMEEMKYKEKEQAILEKTSLPNEPNYKNMFRKTFKQNGKQIQIYAVNYKSLVEKVYSYLFEGGKPETFEQIFQTALKRFINTSDRDGKTFSAYQSYYKRFINKDFGSKALKEITVDDLKIYAKKIVQEKSLNKKSFLKFKSVLNLVYQYAVERKIVDYDISVFVKPKDYNHSLQSDYVKPEDKIFTWDELAVIEKEIRKRMMQKKYSDYYSNGYAILLSMNTAMRAGEICALKWNDVDFEKRQIWIHEMQIKEFTPVGEKNMFKDVPWTKNEKGRSNGGRYFPIDKKLYDLLQEMKNRQTELNISTQYVCCDEAGNAIKSDAYETCLRRLCQSLGFHITNNHAFRMTYNSLVLIPAGFTVTERAAMLGHSVETNLKHYSFDPRNSLADKADKLDMFRNNITPNNLSSNTSNIISFEKEKSLRAL